MEGFRGNPLDLRLCISKGIIPFQKISKWYMNHQSYDIIAFNVASVGLEDSDNEEAL